MNDLYQQFCSRNAKEQSSAIDELRSLNKSPEEKFVKVILKMLCQPKQDSSIVLRLLDILQLDRGTQHKQTPEIEETLTRLLERPESNVREQALLTLLKLQYCRAPSEALQNKLAGLAEKDPNSQVRITALTSLFPSASRGNKRAEAVIERTIATEPLTPIGKHAKKLKSDLAIQRARNLQPV